MGVSGRVDVNMWWCGLDESQGSRSTLQDLRHPGCIGGGHSSIHVMWVAAGWVGADTLDLQMEAVPALEAQGPQYVSVAGVGFGKDHFEGCSLDSFTCTIPELLERWGEVGFGNGLGPVAISFTVATWPVGGGPAGGPEGALGAGLGPGGVRVLGVVLSHLAARDRSGRRG